MTTPLLRTKLYIPPVRPRDRVVPRPRLIERLNEGLRLGRKLSLISAPAGFGKTTLVSEWVGGCERPVAWLSLDEGDNDLNRFLAYFVAALQTIEPSIGQGLSAALQSPGPVSVAAILTPLLNAIAGLSDNLVLVLDDYHVIESQQVDRALTFALDHLPPQMHLVIASRMDPSLPLSRLRVGAQMTEIRENDLRFSPDEINTFLGQVMGLRLSAENVAALDSRTEGWIAGLQLAALSMQGLERGREIAEFVERFTGSDRYIQDYLTDEVLRQRPQGTKDFLLQTSILERLSGPLCDAVRFGDSETPSSSAEGNDSQAILEALDAANLFIVPLDNERRWYRYHHLFGDLLRQRLQQSPPPLNSAHGEGRLTEAGLETSPPPSPTVGGIVAELHRRASEWYEDNGLEIEAFHHATAAHDVERAARLIEGGGMPLTFRGAVTPVLNWLASLPATLLDAKPLLWVTYASAILAGGQVAGVEEKLKAAEAALQGAEPDDETRDLIGRIAATRATLAWGQNQAETIIAQSRRALEYLHPDNLPFRTSTSWKMGSAYQLQGDRAAAAQAYAETIAICEASGNVFINIMASTGLGAVQQAENQLYLAAQTYRRILQLIGDQPLLAACGAHAGLASVLYQWNDVDAAQQHAQQSVQLARQIDSNDAFAECGVVLARVRLVRGDAAGASAILNEADQFVRQHNFVHQMREVAAAQVLVLLRQGNLAGAADLAEGHDLALSQARVHLAQREPSAALAVLEPVRREAEAERWKDVRLKVLVLQAVAHHALGEKHKAWQVLGDALALAQPGGFVRLFVDEGPPMAQLLYQAAARGMMPDYVGKLLAAFETDGHGGEDESNVPSASLTQPLIEPLSERELEVLQLIAQGLSNREIGERLFVAVNTVKGHSRNIFGKLGVHRRTEAVARARELGLL